MHTFTTHQGLVAVIDRANIDTDQIIPKQFLKQIGRTGFGAHLFDDWRYLPDGSPNPDFALNATHVQGASILIAQNNFGCGSSREHAVWAIAEYGFRVVIAPWKDTHGARLPGFADIFRNNCTKNAVLTIELAPDDVHAMIIAVTATPGLTATVDVPAQQLRVHTVPETVYQFEIDAAVKARFIEGLDDIGITMQHASDITAFESQHNRQCGSV